MLPHPIGSELHKQLFAHQDALLVNDIVEFAIIFFQDIVFIFIFFVFVVFEILLPDIEARPFVVFSLFRLVEQLLEDILNLFLELIV